MKVSEDFKRLMVVFLFLLVIEQIIGESFFSVIVPLVGWLSKDLDLKEDVKNIKYLLDSIVYMFKRILHDWRTTLLGISVAITTVAVKLGYIPHDTGNVIVGIVTAALGVAAKDSHNIDSEQESQEKENK